MEEEEDLKSKTTSITTTFIKFDHFHFRILLYLMLSLVAAIRTTNAQNDADVISKLARSIRPPPPNWLGPDPCKWEGITCDKTGHVTAIYLDSKFLSGTIPPEIASLSSLQTLALQKNSFTGSVPPLANMPSLREIFLEGNSFSNISQPFLRGLSNLQSFSISDNPLAPWSIPSSLSDSSSLHTFHARNASVSGLIPDIFSSLPSLQDLRISHNSLTGNLPDSLADSSIHVLWVNNQKQGLTGYLDVLGYMTGLTQIWAQDNGFSGPIPDLSNCDSLFDIQLRDNHLSGVVPPSLMKLPKLANVSLQNNMLMGPVPVFNRGVQVNLGITNSFCNPIPGPCDPQVTALLDIVEFVGFPEELARSWKGNNACKNWDYVTCDASGKVTVINFAKRNWTGLISPAFANLPSLTTIILSGNNLVGTIPDSLTMLKELDKLDLSHNNLTGKVPNFANTVTVKTDDNPFIGTNVDTAASVKLPPGVRNRRHGTRSSDDDSKKKSKLAKGAIAAIVIVTMIVLLIIGFFVYRYVARKKYGGFGKGKRIFDILRMSPMESPGQANMMTTPYMAYDHSSATIQMDWIREVTNNFDEKNILGKGGFGVVYKGILQNGDCIAIKRMVSNLQGTKGISEFEAEIAVLSKVRHRHLVALLGYCVNGRERMVVYEYMPQGTLGQHLFEYEKLGLEPLTWKKRLVIALDVARGVEYLHSLAQQSFIHRDLKTSNILLGDDMRAKVADFGLVKNAPDRGKYSLETRLAGTFGYLAPEYAATGRVTTKVDVFAYGVVLMELLTGRKALDESRPDDEIQLVTWFRKVLGSDDTLIPALDPNLCFDPNSTDKDNDEILQSIKTVVDLSNFCTAREPNQRPDMSHIVNKLSPLVELWKPEVMNENDYGVETETSLTQQLQRWQSGDNTMTGMSGYSGYLYNSSAPPTTPRMNDSFNDIERR